MSQRSEFREEQQETDQKRKKLEAAVLLLLQRKLHQRVRDPENLRLVLSDVTRTVRDSVFQARRLGRSLGLERLNESLKVTGYRGDKLLGSGRFSEARDLDRAIGASRATIETVIRRYERELRRDVETEEAIEISIDETVPRLRVLTKTEVRDSFVSEREEAVAEMQISEAAAFVQVWNISLCRGTCSDCAGLEGEVRPMGMSFPYGPPLLHPNCGCYIDIVPIAWAHSLAA